MIKPFFSQHYEAVKSRMKRLPKLLTAEVENLSYADAVRLVYLFKDGIRNRKFNLKDLKSATIKEKTKQGYKNPDHPLFGESYKKERFNNMMEIVREKTRWVVRPKNKDHFKAKIPLAVLFDVHEYGATINNGKATIRIPPRPALRYAYAKFLADKKKNDPAQRLRERIVKYLNTGEWKATERIVLKDTGGANDYVKPKGFPAWPMT